MYSLETRNDWIDRWRGILISQIVAFHVLGVFANNANGINRDVLVCIIDFLEQYHVSAFVILSGVLWKSKPSFVKFTANKFIRLIFPYLVFGLIWAVLFSIFGAKFINAHSEYATLMQHDEIEWYKYFGSVLFCNGYPGGLGVKVINVLWFLPALFLALEVYYFVDRVAKHKWMNIVFIFVMFAIWLKVRWLQLPWSLSEVPKFVILLMMGRFVVADMVFWLMNWQPLHKLILFSVLFVLLCIPDGIVKICLNLGCEKWNVYFYALVGSVVTAILAQGLHFKVLSAVGRASLGILAVHKFFIIAFQCVPGFIVPLSRSTYLVVVPFTLMVALCVVAISTIVVGVIRIYAPLLIGESVRQSRNDSTMV